MERTGLIEPDGYELIDGELLRKLPKRPQHIRALAMLITWLHAVSPEDNPRSRPEPDALVLNFAVRDLRGDIRPDQLVLVAEVSDTTLGFDLEDKASLYARAGICEYWVVDTNGRRLIVHREPREGRYESVAAYAESERVATLAAPNTAVRVGELF